jgi:hypothetical protein
MKRKEAKNLFICFAKTSGSEAKRIPFRFRIEAGKNVESKPAPPNPERSGQ